MVCVRSWSEVHASRGEDEKKGGWRKVRKEGIRGSKKKEK
jgi:hypothetical protein